MERPIGRAVENDNENLHGLLHRACDVTLRQVGLHDSWDRPYQFGNRPDKSLVQRIRGLPKKDTRARRNVHGLPTLIS